MVHSTVDHKTSNFSVGDNKMSIFLMYEKTLSMYQ